MAGGLVVGNNVFAHVPDIVDFASGLRALVADDGVCRWSSRTAAADRGRQYDTIYHEHYSYFTLRTAAAALATAGLAVVDVVELASHGGSLRVICSRPRPPAADARVGARARPPRRPPVCDTVEGHAGFARPSSGSETDLVDLLTGEPATAAGGRLRRARQGQHPAQPLRHPARPARRTRSTATLQAGTVPAGHAHPDPRAGAARPGPARPDLILPWNLATEIVAQLAYTREWGARFVVPIPAAGIV